MAEEKEKPLTREDVLKLIQENGGTAEGLDLSGKTFEKGIDLSGLGLQRIILREAVLEDAHFEGSKLWGAHLEEANLQYAHLEEVELLEAHLQEANLVGAHLERAVLFSAHLEGADLSITHLQGADFGDAHLDGAFLWGAKFSSDTDLENVDWGDYILGEEKGEKRWGEREEYLAIWAVDNTYRRLKLWYAEHGIYNVVGEFFFREMTIRRKLLKWWPKPWNRAWSKFVSLVCGYGEKWQRVIISAAVVVFGLAVIYFFLGAFSPGTFPGCLYYSVVSFTALGYGSWVYPEPESWAKGLGAAEAALGVFIMALFLITFVRKMTR